MTASATTRGSRAFVAAGVVWFVAFNATVLAGVGRSATAVLGLYGFVFAVIFGKAYALVPSYFDRALVAPSAPLVHLPFAVVGMLYTFGFFTLLAYTPLVLGLGTVRIGLVFFCWGLFLIVGSAAVSPRLNERFGTPEATAGALAGFAGVLCLMWLSSASGVLSGLVVLGGLFCGILNANLSTLAMGISSHSRSAASGAFNCLRFSGGAFAPITAGYLGQTYGATLPFLLGAAVVGVGRVVLLGRFGEFRFTTPEPAHDH